MKILVTGATGLIGRHLISSLLDQGHEPSILTRDKKKASLIFPSLKIWEWNPSKTLPPRESLESVEGIVHLMGENLSHKRWSQKQKQKILDSREKSTQNLVRGIQKYKTPLKVFIQASAIGIYQDKNVHLNSSDQNAKNFLIEVCQKWEKSSIELDSSTRRVVLRLGVVLSKEGGMLNKVIPLFKWGLGGPIGRGKRMMSWIHIKDVTRLIMEILRFPKWKGTYNAVCSQPISNQQFTKALSSSLGRWAIIPVPPFLIRLLYGSMSILVLDSIAVYPEGLEKQDFQCEFNSIDPTLEGL